MSEKPIEKSSEQRIEEAMRQEEMECTCECERDHCSECMEEDVAEVETDEAVEIDEDGKEIVEVYLEDLEVLAEQLAEYEDVLEEVSKDEDIGDKIEKVLFKERNVYIEGTIDEDNCSHVSAMIHYYNAVDKENNIPVDERESIKIYINSPGGSLSHGKKVLAAMESSTTPIETISQGGQLASMAFVLFVGADVRKMSRHSETMYHNLLAGSEGTFSEMKNQISYYERLQNEMDEYVAERTNIPLKKLRKLRQKNQDWHLTFNECKEYGVFTEQI